MFRTSQHRDSRSSASSYHMLHNRAPGPKIGLPGRFRPDCFLENTKIVPPAGQPSACRRADFEAFPIIIRPGNPISGPEAVLRDEGQLVFGRIPLRGPLRRHGVGLVPHLARLSWHSGPCAERWALIRCKCRSSAGFARRCQGERAAGFARRCQGEPTTDRPHPEPVPVSAK